MLKTDEYRETILKLKKAIIDTPIEELDRLRDNICVLDIDPKIKQVALMDIDFKQNNMVYAHEAVATLSDQIGVD